MFTYFQAIQNITSPMSHRSEHIEDSAICFLSRLVYGNRSVLFNTKQ